MNIFENMSTFVIQNQIIIEYDAESQHKIDEAEDSSAVLGRSDPRGDARGGQDRCQPVDSQALIFLTTVCLQILSNLSNELGDTLSGTDSG